MASTVLYLGAPGSGKSTLMREHVRQLASAADAPLFFIVDHDDSWTGHPVYTSAASWWRAPSPVSVFRGVPPLEVAQLAIDAGWSVYVDDEVDGALSESWKASPLREIVKRGRHLRNRAGEVTAVSAMLATHRPANLPTDVLGLFHRVYVGRLHSSTDAERVYREGWIRGASSAVEAQRELEARKPGSFTTWP